MRPATVFLAVLALLQPLQPFQPFLYGQAFEVPVRRAEPVNPVPSPAAAQQAATPAPPGPPTPPAVPFDFDNPQRPVRPAAASPSAPALRPAPPPEAAEPSNPDDIRVAPNVGQSPEKAQISVANGLYARKLYELAAPEYERYLGIYGNGADRQTALFRLGECYSKMGNLNSAKNSYTMLLASFTAGDFIGPAAYRLADLFFQEKDYDDALPYFRQASVREKDPAVANAAKFYEARCLENLHHPNEACDIYQTLLVDKANNPFVDVSRFSLARLQLDLGQKNEALTQYQAIAAETTQPAAKAEATVKAALIELDLGDNAKAAVELKKALALPEIGHFKEAAEFGLLRIDYNSGKYKDFLQTYAMSESDLSPEEKPDAMLLAASAYRQLGDQAAARTIFEQIIAGFPDSTAAKEARYTRLLTLYSAGDPDLVKEVDAYLALNPESEKKDQLALLKAEYFFKNNDFAHAAPLYESVQSSVLSDTFRADAQFKLGWSRVQTHENDKAVKAFSDFITEYNDNKLVPKALAQRALAYESLSDLPSALKDCDELIDRYPKAPEREFALEQKARILGKQDDNKGMSGAFALLLQDYPKTPAAANANYCIGWAAYDAKDYRGAIQPLEAARKLDKDQFFEKATFKIMLSYYNLGDQRVPLAREVDRYMKGGGKGKVPAEILRALGGDFFKANDFADSQKYLGELTARPDATPADWLLLGTALSRAGKFGDAEKAFGSYLKLSGPEPVPKATGLLALGQAQLGLSQFDDARKSAEDALALQPEGVLNAKGRLLSGDIDMASGRYDEAAKVFQSVSLIFSDDAEITPLALEKAYEALKKAGKNVEAEKVLNNLQSHFPEYQLQKTVSAPL